MVTQLAARVREPRRLIAAFAEAAATGALGAPAGRSGPAVGNGARPSPAPGGSAHVAGSAANGSSREELVASPFAERVLQGSPE
jgi:hypothetical protein